MSKISAQLQTVKADGRVTASEWTRTVGPLAEGLPPVASEEARQLLALWADATVALDEEARRGVVDVLRKRGYAVPLEGRDAAQVKRIVADNITEPDLELERLLRLVGREDAELVVATADNGFEVTHPAFEGKLWTNPDELPGNGLDDDGNGKVDDVHGWDFVQGDADVLARLPGEHVGNEHGTHVAGIAGRGTNGLKGMMLRVSAPLLIQNVLAGLEYAIANGARLINVSLKIDDANSTRQVKALMERHPEVLFVKAAGNEGKYLGRDRWTVPEMYIASNVLPNMLVVTAADPDGGFDARANHGVPYTDVGAHGIDVFSAWPGGGYGSKEGTSMAGPNAMAVGGKVMLLCPTLDAAEVKRLLVETSDAQDGWQGIVNAGGPMNPTRALRFAALLQRVETGTNEAAAADLVGLHGAERERLLAMLPSYRSSAGESLWRGFVGAIDWLGSLFRAK
jgi:subtilisin family serine protease